jgi:hypothetical protein
MGPGQRGELKEHPAASPSCGGFTQVSEGIAPSFFRPLDPNGLKDKAARATGFAQLIAIIRYAVGGLIPPPKQQDHFFDAHFSTK